MAATSAVAIGMRSATLQVIAGKVIDAHGIQSRFAFARNGPTIASEAFKQ